MSDQPVYASSLQRSMHPDVTVAAGGRVVASPYAKKLAREANVDISQATGTGPNGRIVAADVQQLIESGGGQAAEASAEAPSVRKAPILVDATPCQKLNGQGYLKP